MNKQKGFTIIELIVVIAIIAVLASIVLVNVTTYLNKGKDAAGKEAMHTLQTDVISTANGGLYTASVTANCVNTNLAYKALLAYDASMVCHGSSTTTPVDSAWCAALKLPTGQMYCADSTGAAINSAQTTQALACPVTTGVCVP